MSETATTTIPGLVAGTYALDVAHTESYMINSIKLHKRYGQNLQNCLDQEKAAVPESLVASARSYGAAQCQSKRSSNFPLRNASTNAA